MNSGRFKSYAQTVISLLKKLAKKTKTNLDNLDPNDFSKGEIMGYYSIIVLLKHQAFVFCLDQKELGLADINPDVDLLGLRQNSDIDFGEDNWVIDVMNEEKVRGYLRDTIRLLKDQAIEAKECADNPKKDFEIYSQGELMAYSSAFSILKNQASVFNISEEELGIVSVGN